MKKNYFLILTTLSVFFSFCGHAQEIIPAIQWQKTIGGAASDQLFAMEATADHGYILGGYSYSNISGEKTANSKGGSDYWILKLDSTGATEWQQTIGGSQNDMLGSIKPCADGTYIVSGTSFSGNDGDKTDTLRDDPALSATYGSDLWIIKLDAQGNILWQKAYGGLYAESGFDSTYSYSYLHHTYIEPTADGGYIAGVSSTSGISGDKTEVNRTEANAMFSFLYPIMADYWILKLDASGNIQWQKTYGGEDADRITCVRQTADGGYIVGGTAGSMFLTLFGITVSGGDKTGAIRGKSDYWILKLDATGAIQWQQTFGGSGEDQLHSIDVNPDGSYIVGGYSQSGISGDKTDTCRGDYDYWILKLDVSGNIVWQKTIGGNGSDLLSSIRRTADGAYLVSGASSSGISGEKTTLGYGGASDYWLLKLSGTGEILWQKTLGGTGTNLEHPEMAVTLAPTADGGYIAGGFSDAPLSGTKTDVCRGDYDYWIVKLNHCSADTTTITTSFCTGQSYTLPDGQMAQIAGTYYSVLNGNDGCDSVIRTQLSEVTISKVLTVVQDKLVAQTIAGATYQWINCGTLLPVPGATDTEFKPLTEGYYAVVITLNNCIDTTMCYGFDPVTGIKGTLRHSGLSIYPNPARDRIYVESRNGLLLQQAELTDMTGRSIRITPRFAAGSSKEVIDLHAMAPGIYLLKVQTNKNTFISRINILP